MLSGEAVTVLGRGCIMLGDILLAKWMQMKPRRSMVRGACTAS